MIKELMLKFDYGWRMRGLWLVLHIISIYSAIMAIHSILVGHYCLQ